MKAILSNIYYDVMDIAVLAEANIFEQGASSEGGSILPFLGFMCSLFAIVFLGIGVVRYFSAKSRFNMYFDLRDQVQDAPSEEKYAKEMKAGKIAIIVGAILMVLSFVLL